MTQYPLRSQIIWEGFVSACLYQPMKIFDARNRVGNHWHLTQPWNYGEQNKIARKIDKDLEQKEWKNFFLVVKRKCTHPLTHTTCSDSLNYISPNKRRKRGKKMISKLATAKSNFPWRILFTKKKSDEGEEKSNVFSNFLGTESRLFTAFLRMIWVAVNNWRPFLFSTSTFVSLIHAILRNNCDIEEA